MVRKLGVVVVSAFLIALIFLCQAGGAFFREGFMERETLDSGKDVFLEIEVNGAMQVRSKCPDGVFIFLTPPDLDELKQRLIHRGTDSMDVINKRIRKAFDEIRMMQNYDYAVVNDKVPNAVAKIKDIIRTERLRVNRVMPRYLEMLGDSAQ